MAIIPSQIDNDRNSFFKNCEYITKAPACLFLEGTRFTAKAKVLPIPLYAYAGLEKGHKEFKYEEYNYDLAYTAEEAQRLTDLVGFPKDNKLAASQILSQMPEEERMFLTTTPHSSLINYRRKYYEVFLNTQVKEMFKYSITNEKVIRESGAKKRSDFTMEVRQKMVMLFHKYLAEEFEDCYKLKVWSHMPSVSGLNEGAAIAAASTLAIYLALSREKYPDVIKWLNELRTNLWEEISIDNTLAGMFTMALAFDFFANGAAVFASLLGCTREQEIINYDCLVFDKLKNFFNPYPEFKNDEERKKFDKDKGIIAYFNKGEELRSYSDRGESLFNWSYEKYDPNNKLAMALITEPPFLLETEKLKIPDNLAIKCWKVSPDIYAIVGDPVTVALCEKNPEKYIFKTREGGPTHFDVIYTSRREGWGSEGVGLEVSEKSDINQPVEEKLELGLDDLSKPYVKINGKGITINERFFVDLAYFAVSKLKRPDGWVDLKKELKWTERHIKDYPSDLKDVLEKGSYNKPADKGVFLDRLAGQGKIRLGIFKADPRCIIINENLRNFESEHRWTVKKTIDDIFWELDCRKAGGREIDFQMTKEVMDKLRFDREKIELQELRPMLRHVFVISQAVKIMGWKFHDAQWLREWKKFLKQCDKFYELLKYNPKEREEIGLYLGL